MHDSMGRGARITLARVTNGNPPVIDLQCLIFLKDLKLGFQSVHILVKRRIGFKL
jgi:hypothetical protein